MEEPKVAQGEPVGAGAASSSEPHRDGAASGPKPRAPAEPHRDGAASGPKPRAPAEPLFEAQADLDLPGETGRQARIFAVWLVCLAIAVAVGSAVGAHVAPEDELSLRATQELSRSRTAKAKVAFLFGLALPALLTLALNARYRRGGAHARGILVDVTPDGRELRIWGRGYGTRVVLEGADVRERLVDVYAGRLGAWRQRRLRVKGNLRGGGREIELATTARESDGSDGLRVEGGEGDCIELPREAFDDLRAIVLEAASRAG